MSDIFRSLRTRNYRLYFGGQVVSLIGTWMQITANAWLVLKLTNSGFAVGIAAALQFGPTLIGGAWGGLFADRFPKRRTLLVTQTLFLFQATALGVLTAGGWTKLWMVYSLIFLYGCVQVFDIPSRQAFVSEMVPTDDVINAVGLNSAVFNGARMVGPAIAGLLIAKVSISLCFFINGASFLAVLVALLAMRERELLAHNAARPEGKGQIRAGLRYVASRPDLLMSLIVMTVVGTLALNFQIVLPLLARFTFKGNAATYGWLQVAMASGSVVGAMYAASRKHASAKLLIGSTFALGGTMLVAAAVPTLRTEYIALPFVGLSAMLFITASNSLLQTRSAPEMRGRVLALWSLVFLGSTPIGGPLVGWISQKWSPRFGLGIGGVACLIVGTAVAPFLIRRTRAKAAADALLEEELPPELIEAEAEAEAEAAIAGGGS